MRNRRFVSRAGDKLAFALEAFGLDPTGCISADLGCHVGGFTDCLLRAGARRVYSVDTAKNIIDWHLRNDERVIVREHTNALHVELPEPVEIVTIDVAWTRQRLIVPAAASLLVAGGVMISLIKPQYEAAQNERRGGRIRDECVEDLLDRVVGGLREAAFAVSEPVRSPLVGGKGSNPEFFVRIEPG